MSEDKKVNNMRTLLNGDHAKGQIERALPKYCTPDRFLRVATTYLNKNPKLADCTQDSFINCILQCAQLGLELDGRLVHLIPYGNQCTFVIDYKGIVTIIMRSGLVSYLHADVVCENDKFSYKNGRVDHEIDFKNPRGKVYAAYCICQLKDGSEKHEVMGMEDLEQVKAASKSAKSGPWTTWANEMYKKSVFKRLAKWLPWEDSRIREALEQDNDFRNEKEINPIAEGRQAKSSSRIEQMKQKYIPTRVEPAGNDLEETGEMSEFDLLKAKVIDSKSKDKLYELMDLSRTYSLADNEKALLESICIAKEQELEA